MIDIKEISILILTFDLNVHSGTHWFADSVLGQALVIAGMMRLDVMNFQELLANVDAGLFGVIFVQMFSLKSRSSIVKFLPLNHFSGTLTRKDHEISGVGKPEARQWMINFRSRCWITKLRLV